jgi:hypothetical protein
MFLFSENCVAFWEFVAKEKRLLLLGTLFGLAIYIIKKYLKAKEELWKFKYFFTMQKNIIFKKNPVKETKISLQDIIITLL